MYINGNSNIAQIFKIKISKRLPELRTLASLQAGNSPAPTCETVLLATNGLLDRARSEIVAASARVAAAMEAVHRSLRNALSDNTALDINSALVSARDGGMSSFQYSALRQMVPFPSANSKTAHTPCKLTLCRRRKSFGVC